MGKLVVIRGKPVGFRADKIVECSPGLSRDLPELHLVAPIQGGAGYSAVALKTPQEKGGSQPRADKGNA